ncbi:NAD(P)H dehydrogenase [Marinicauda salina]|uniref:NAD(P)H dehydrogenase n=1 Tax=Marinicauda salina TaxID=2135793 RepID=A0A2U2BR66_9PROT|nr:NAD(P)H-dependent oxidoreductase [Marinicauda salina]PWE16502.1 NAD(P)H dehydrogenase [Marinicauda salina]
MSCSICVINGHPDPAPERFCFALADAYENAAREAGHTVRRIDVGAVDLEFLVHPKELETPPDDAITAEREKIAAADHVVLIYPLWLGTMPARLKAFLEQVARDGFFIGPGVSESSWPAKKMKGKSARIIVTMGMPGFAYRLFFGGHSLKGLEKGIFGIAGFKPVRDTIFGLVESGPERRARMLEKTAALGRAGR